MSAAIRLDIAYDGQGFAGWAAQPGRRTVQSELESALGPIVGEPVALTVAGRTDAGVHALGQVASMPAPRRFADSERAERIARAVSSKLAGDLQVTASRLIEEGFDARRDARSRTYRYRVLATRGDDPFERGRALRWPYAVDFDALAACASASIGRHDFTAFTRTRSGHVHFHRELLDCRWSRRPARFGAELLTLEVTADAFLRNMVRVLVGTMLSVASGRRSPAEFAALLDGAPRTSAGDTAPAHGLYLASVQY